MTETVSRLERTGVLTKVEPFSIISPGECVLVICDSETNPEHIVPRQLAVTLRVISTEAGVLACGLGEGSDAEMQGTLGINPDEAIIDSIRRWNTRCHARHVFLVVNPHTTMGMFEADPTLVELIDHMMRAAVEVKDRVRNIEVTPILHVPNAGSFNNYRVDSAAWRVFYDEYECDELGHDGEGTRLALA